MRGNHEGLVRRTGKRGAASASSSKVTKPIDCEIGVIPVSVGRRPASALKPKQHLQSVGFRALYLDLAGSLSYRSAASVLNRLLHRGDDSRIKVSTLEDRIESQGDSLSESCMRKAGDVLRRNGVEDPDGVITAESHVPASVLHPHLPGLLDERASRKLIADYNRKADGGRGLEYDVSACRIEPSSDRCCYISVDDVGVRFQRERRKGRYLKDRKFIENTVIHIQAGNLQYTMTSTVMRDAFKLLTAFLLDNGLMEGHRLVFFTDGAVRIREYIGRYFGFRQHTVILDWLHLKKKCGEYLSMAIKGTRAEKREIRRELVSILWTGDVGRAVEFIGSIRDGNVRNTKSLDGLKEYIGRKSPCLTCYAMRHALGLRVSSNRVEKANDMVVASRQKHNGMSWSTRGSGALAVITAARINGEILHWIETGDIKFKMAG